jgi:hypothetical protein
MSNYNYNLHTEEIEIFVICGSCGESCPQAHPSLPSVSYYGSTLDSLGASVCMCGENNWKILSKVEYLRIRRDFKINKLTNEH